jgi:hypothetical protein
MLNTFEFRFYFRNNLRGETFEQFGPQKKRNLATKFGRPPGATLAQAKARLRQPLLLRCAGGRGPQLGAGRCRRRHRRHRRRRAATAAAATAAVAAAAAVAATVAATFAAAVATSVAAATGTIDAEYRRPVRKLLLLETLLPHFAFRAPPALLSRRYTTTYLI